MLTKEQAIADAWLAIAELVGKEYFRTHFESSCQSYPDEDSDEANFEYFLAFEGDEKMGLWTVYARVSVNRETGKITLLDYKLPNGMSMENPVKPVNR